MICAACQNGNYFQKYPDTIECKECGTKWKCYGLQTKSYRSYKYKQGRS